MEVNSWRKKQCRQGSVEKGSKIGRKQSGYHTQRKTKKNRGR